MVERRERLPHIQLQLTTEGSASLPRGGARSKNKITIVNAGNRQGHGSKFLSKILVSHLVLLPLKTCVPN